MVARGLSGGRGRAGLPEPVRRRLLADVMGFLGDLLRLAVALIYWNARKAAFRAGGAVGRCRCQNPSDSGEAMRTGCEAMVHWARPERFRRVCPLLARNSSGDWVCSVGERDVRPFWGRAIAWYAGTAAVVALAAVLVVFGVMRWIGYPVSFRQVAWPPAWSELRVVRSELFIARAREDFAAGRVREAVSALATARAYDPGNYPVGLLLAQFYQAGQPSAADELYRHLLVDHPARAEATAEAWLRSLLARARMHEVAMLAEKRLAAGEGTAAWTHALVFATRLAREPDWLRRALEMPGLPRPAADVLALEVAQADRTDAAATRRLLTEAPLPEDFPYAWVHRAARLTELGFPDDALRLLRDAKQRGAVGGRDLVRAALAAYDRAGQRELLEREVEALLARNGPGELEIVGLHLLLRPDASLVAKCLDGARRIPANAGEGWRPAALAAYCLAATSGDAAVAGELKQRLTAAEFGVQGGLAQLELFFSRKRSVQGLTIVLPYVQPLPLDLNYTLLEKYLGENKESGKRP